MNDKALLVLTPDASLAKRLEVAFAGAHGAVHWCGDEAEADDLLAGTAIAVVIVDLALVAAAGAIALRGAAVRRIPVLAIGVGSTEPLVRAWQHSGAASLIARLGAGAAAHELDLGAVVAAVGSLLGGERGGLARHLDLGAMLHERVVTGAADREPVLAALRQLTDELGLGSRRGRLVCDVADELTTNAVYDAPRDALGRPRYAAVDRREKLELEAAEHVAVSFGADERRVGLSISDRFGGLLGARLASCLLRTAASGDQIEHKQGGAGLGLYLAVRSADELVIAVEPGRRTEITALWRRDRRPDAAGPTLHYLVVEPRPVGGALEVAMATSPEIDDGRGDDPLAELRGVHLLRSVEPPGLDTTIARLRGTTNASHAVAAAAAYLIGEWRAAVVLEVGVDAIRAVCAAGDVEPLDAVAGYSVSRVGRNALSHLAVRSGMMLGPLSHPSEEAALAETLLGQVPADGIAMALPVGVEVRYLLFACRPRGRGAEGRSEHQRLLSELTLTLARLEREGGGARDRAVG